jgi:hypothetical protein
MDTTDLLYQDPEDNFDYMYQEGDRKKQVKEQMPEILKKKAKYGINWLVFKVYYMLYSAPLWDKEVHMNRVRGMIETWLENTTYEQLVEANIITEQDIIDNYKQL